MTLALDTDILVNWLMAGAPHHQATRLLIREQVRVQGNRLGLVPQVLFEFVHVSTDGRRFPEPLAMGQAVAHCRRLWESLEVERILPDATVLPRSLQLLDELGLGRKRILDTALAATLQAAGVRRLATLNGGDFRVFPFLEIVAP